MNDCLHREQLGQVIGYMNGLPVREYFNERTAQPIDDDGRPIKEEQCALNTQQ